MTVVTLTCGHTHDHPMNTWRPGTRAYCPSCDRPAGVIAVEYVPEDDPDPLEDPLDYCPRCGLPWEHHANRGTGDAAEPVCLCRHGEEWDECRGPFCKGSL